MTDQKLTPQDADQKELPEADPQDDASLQDASLQEDGDNIHGEGNYAASRKFDADEKDFIAKNRDAIPGLAKDAADALDGPEGDELRKAEEETRARVA
jgi:hypothetical protein